MANSDATRGYYRFPTLSSTTLAFATEGDIWTVEATGGTARRLTSGTGQAQHLSMSPDGASIAYTSDEDGTPAVYVIPSRGGVPRRLTFEAGQTLTSGWTVSGDAVLYATSSRAPHPGQMELHRVSVGGGLPERVEVGPAMLAAMHTDGRIVLNRHSVDPARWKRYRGGKAGELWIGHPDRGEFVKLVDLGGNCAHPFWVGDRVGFISDHDGFGDVFTVGADGKDLVRHTRLTDFYARWPAAHGSVVVFQSGGELFRLDLGSGGDPERIEIETPSARAPSRRKFVSLSHYLEDFAIHPDGGSVLYTVRGQLITMPNWQGAPHVVAAEPGVRFRAARWLPDGKRILAVADRAGEEQLELHSPDPATDREDHGNPGVGRVEAWTPSPDERRIALTDHQRRNYVYDLEERALTTIDRSEHISFNHQPGDFAWSPDGRFLAYSHVGAAAVSYLKIHDCTTGETHDVTTPEHDDFCPAFHPEGKLLYFLSRRVLDPVLDTRELDASFPRPVRAYVIPLTDDEISPFDRWEPEGPLFPDLLEALSKKRRKAASEEKAAPPEVRIDFDGIGERVRAVPIPPGNYAQLHCDGERLYLLDVPIKGLLSQPDSFNAPPPSDRILWSFGVDDREFTKKMAGVTEFHAAQSGVALAIRAGHRVRIVPTMEKPGGSDAPADAKPSRKTGWVDTGRIRVAISPTAEWRQIFHEAWRMQKEFFWTEDLSRVDWPEVKRRYLPLLDRIGSRHELSDVIWEMLGELGTSHAYEVGGDLERGRVFPVGQLGADYRWRDDVSAYEIVALPRGDSWMDDARAPLATPGIGLRPGDLLLEVDGYRVESTVTPGELLQDRAGKRVTLTVASASSPEEPRLVVVKALASEYPLRHRAWVEDNRARVARETGDRVGYIHIPDMGVEGLVEFHRGWWAQWNHSALIVDVRFNRGGFVGQILLEKLTRKIVGYVKPRWGQPEPFPSQSLRGPVVVLCNEYTGSDGDIFCQTVRNLGLAPLIGKRTWGGVVGISPTRRFLDGGLTTQPEYAFWFHGPRWGVENAGVSPDIEVEYPPDEWKRGHDPQLQRAIEEVLQRLESQPAEIPDFGPRPDLRPPGRS